MLSAKAIRAIITRKIEVMGPTPPEVRTIRLRLGDNPEEKINEIPDSLIDLWLEEERRLG